MVDDKMHPYRKVIGGWNDTRTPVRLPPRPGFPLGLDQVRLACRHEVLTQVQPHPDSKDDSMRPLPPPDQVRCLICPRVDGVRT